jgi:hypothetical protein
LGSGVGVKFKRPPLAAGPDLRYAGTVELAERNPTLDNAEKLPTTSKDLVT